MKDKYRTRVPGIGNSMNKITDADVLGELKIFVKDKVNSSRR